MPRRLVRLLGLVVVLLTLLGASVVAPTAPSGAQAPRRAAARTGAPVLVGCAHAAERVAVTVDTVLDPACTYTGGVDVTASGVTLDCRGASIQGGTTGEGILVSTPVDVVLHDVTIRGCDVHGFGNALRITRVGFRTLAAGHEYDATTQRILIEDSTFAGAHGVGLYVDGYVADVTMRRLTLEGNGSTGVYLETGSRRNVVADSTFLGNGGIENSETGQPYVLAGMRFWYWGTGREGLAVDGSHENTITGNTFRGNVAGSIFLYTNCGEYHLTHADSWLPRRYGSYGNVIDRNRFEGDPIGVWVGSRMGENTLPMECSDPAYVETPTLRVTRDRAPDNVVSANAFAGTPYGIRVEDDGTQVRGNTFSGSDPGAVAVLVGTRYRTTALAHPVTGTVLADNRSSIAGAAAPYRWVFGLAGTHESGDTALGVDAPLCPGAAAAPDPFIFVRAFAAYPEGAPVPARPATAAVHPAPQPACPRMVGTATTVTGAPGGAAPASSPTASAVVATPAYAG